MDLGDITQLVLVVTTGQEADERLRALEDECSTLRQELTEIVERQDLTERALLQDPGRVKPVPPQGARERIVTPH
jgi:hypothetical protein